MNRFLTLLIVAFTAVNFQIHAGILPVTRGKIATPIAGASQNAQPVIVGQGTASTAVAIPTVINPGLAYADVLKQGVVTFGVDHHYDSLFPTQKISVKLLIKKYASVTATTFSTETVYLTIWNAHQDSLSFQDKATYFFNNVEKYSIDIEEISVDDVVVTRLPSNLYVYADLFVNRVFDFSANTNIIPVLNNTTSQTLIDTDCDQFMDKVKISWDPIPGAEEYQLEWTFVNSYGEQSGSVVPANQLSVNYKLNATRISTTGLSYEIGLAFDQGYLCYRLRAVGRNINDQSKRIFGFWSSVVDEKAVHQTNYLEITPQMAFEIKKNWQYAVTFAEEGKSKEVISFFDGSLRNRQMVTRINSDNNVIVGQTIYDHQGRGTVQVLPTPVNAPNCGVTTNNTAASLKYYPNWSKENGTLEDFDRTSFDLSDGTDSCLLVTNSMDNSAGAARYYSNQNPSNTNEKGYVPTANGFPYSQVEYTPDNTGRIRRQGGVGPDFQLGSGHETKYYYSQPVQEQLNRMFGSEVGDYSHYQKNMVVDPNGQVSVSFLDQEGRVIATSLAGVSPANLIPLPSNTAAVPITSTLISSDKPATIENMALVHNQKITFSSATDVKIAYGYEIPAYKDQSCAASLCFDCIYDLSLSFIDECGDDLLAGANLSNKITGRFVQTPSGVAQFQTLCANGQFSYQLPLVTIPTVPVGEYQLVKTLKINQRAFDYYLAEYLNPATNTCIPSLEEQLAIEQAAFDSTACNPLSCEACVAALGSLDEFLTAGSGTVDEYNELVASCMEPCNQKSPCEVMKEILISDLVPGGQYAEFEDQNGQFNVNNPLSVFNVSNAFPLANANWKHPKFIVNGTTISEYRKDDLVTRARVVVSKINATTYLPAVDNISLVSLDPTTGIYYTYPENLTNVADFIVQFQNNLSWANSLLPYHPEYGYLKTCLDWEKPVGNETMTSNEFDKQLMLVETWNDAVTKGFIKSNYASIQNVNDRLNDWFIPVTTTNPAKVYDPFWAHLPYASQGINQAFEDRILSYQTVGGVSYSLMQFAAIISRCGASSIGYQPTATCTRFGDNVASSQNTQANTAMRDAEWLAFRSLYVAVKQELQQAIAHENALTNPLYAGYNGCIGTGSFDPSLQMIDYANYPSSPYLNANQPCNNATASLYASKTKRFVTPIEANNTGGSQISNNEVAYQNYLQTGKCPANNALTGLLSELAQTDKLDNPMYNVSTLPSFSALELGLHNFQLTGPLPIVSGTTSASSNQLSLTWQDNQGGTYATVSLEKQPNEPITFVWDDITLLHNLQVTNTSNPNLTLFTILAKVPANGTIENVTLSGSTSLPIASCHFEQVCEKNQFGTDITVLLKLIAATGNFSTTYPVQGNGAVSPNLATSVIEASIQAQSNSLIDWSFDGATNFYLTDANTGNRLVIQINSTSPTNFNIVDLSNVAAMEQLIVGPMHTGAIVLNDASGNFLVKLNVSFFKEINGQRTSLPIGLCDLPTPIMCKSNAHQSFRDLETFLTEILPNNTSGTYPFSSYIAYSSLLQGQIQGSNNNITGTVTQQGETEFLTADSLCGFQLVVRKDSLPESAFAVITSVGELEVMGNPDETGEYHDFKIAVTFTVGANVFSGFVYGTSCIGIKPCEVCPKPTSIFDESTVVIGEKNQALIDNGMTYEDQSTLNYKAYSTAIDSLNSRNNLYNTPEMVNRVAYDYFAKNGIAYPINSYLKFINEFDIHFDARQYLEDPLLFIMEYGPSTNVNMEYQRYTNAINYYNGLRSVGTLQPITTVTIDDFAVTKYVDHLQEYLDYIAANKYIPSIPVAVDQYPTLANAAIENSDCMQLYQEYVQAYQWYQQNFSSFTACGKLAEPVTFYSYESFIENNLCCANSGTTLFENYIASFYNVALCPKAIPMKASCTTSEVVNEDECQKNWTVYVETINQFNASFYAQTDSVTLVVLYPDFNSFIQSGKCDCIGDYIKYLRNYIAADQTTIQFLNTPVQTIDEFCPSAVLPPATDPCVSAYDNYLSCIQHYNNWAINNNGAYITDIVRLEDFVSNNLCLCVDVYCAALQQVIDGVISFERLPDILSICNETSQAPCTPTQESLNGIEIPYVQFIDPCYELFNNVAMINAQHTYDSIIAVYTQQFTENYIAHCMTAKESLKITFNEAEHHFTLYYYDQAGNLIKTVPPEGVELLDLSNGLSDYIDQQRVQGLNTVTTMHRLETRYQYNSLNQLVAQTMPDQDNMNILEEFLPSGIPANFKTTAIQMLDAALGYMTGYVELNPGIGMGTRGYLLRTTTGGASWVKVAGTVAATLKKTVWLNDTYGYAFGADGELFETRNGGNQWDLLNTYANNITTRIAAVSPIGATKLLAVTADGKWFTIESNYGTATATTLSQPVSITINNLQVLNVTDMTCYPNATGLPLIYITAQTQHSVTNQIGYQLIKGSPNALNGFDWLEQQFTATAGKVAAFYNNTSGYVFGDEGRMIHLETIGNNQVASLTMSGERSPVLEAYFLNKDKGIACFQTATGPQIKVTSDGGSTWTGITQLNGQNFRLSLLQRTAAPTSNLRLVASNGAQTYVLVLATGTNLSVVAQNSTTTPSTAALNASVDALAGVAVGTNYTYYYLKNNQLYKSTMTANNGAASVTWSQASVSYNSIFGITYIPTNVKLSAAVQNNTVVLSVLEQNGNLRILKAPLTSNNFSLSAYSGVSSVALINASSTGTDQYWILRNTNNTVQKIPVLGSSVSTITTTASDLTQVAATEKRLLAFGTNGAIALTDVDVNSGLTNVSFTADPITWSKLPLQALAKNGNAIVVVGDKGTVLYKHNSTDGTPVWNSLGVQTSANLTASAALNAGNWAVVGSQGYSQRLNTTTATSFTTIPFVSNAGGSLAQIFPSVTWKSVGVLGNRICISGSNGTLAFTTDWTTTDWMAQSILNNQHISSVVFKPSGSFTVLTTENGKMYRLVGFNTTENTQLFGPKYNDVHFASSSVGSFVGAHFAVKTTQTGGLIWNSLLPTVITNSGASWTTYTNKITNVWTAQSAQGQAIVLFAGNGIVGQAKNNQVYAQTASGPVTTLKCASAASTNGYYSIGNTVYRFGIHFTNPVSSCVSWTGNSSFVQTGTINALHVFQNTGYVAVGNGFIDYRFQPIIGTGVSLTTSMPGVNLRTVYFHDNRVGIAAGDNFQWVDIEAVTDPLSKVWTSFVKNNVSSVFITAETALTGNTAPTARITALAFGDRSHCVWGGVSTASYVRYANDLRNRISARFFYDRLGRIVVSQNSRQQAQNRFSYSLYDALGRVVEAGEKTENTPGANVLAFTQIFGAYVGGNLVPSVIDDNKLKSWLDTQATNTRKEITRSYYDRTNTSILAQLPSSFTPDPLTQRKRIVHVTYETAYDSNDATYDHATHYDYDIHGNVKTLLQDNANLGALNQLASQRFKRMDYTFDLISGNVHRVDYETNKADQWHHAYSYDADNRITAVYTTSATPLVNDPLAMSSLQNEPLLNPTWEKEAAYSYYAHGPLARTVIGEQEVQGLDYVYTLQGWIKAVNSNNLDANNDPGKDGLGLSANHRVAQDVMGYSLHYFNNDYLPIVNGNITFIADQTNSDMLQNSSDLYNGNIARMVTTITDPNSRAVLPLGNAYGYDQLNRLQKAVSFDQLNGNAWAGGAPAKYENSFTYDANGNILTQTRKDDNNQVIDELAYFYPQNAANKTVRNRLLYVSDNVDYDASDIDPGMAINNYSYDAEGRLIQDLQEGIDEIKWRVDGKVKSIKQSDNKQGEFSLSFDYDAMGHRIAKHSYDKDQAYNNGLGQLVKSTYYVLDAQGNTMATYERSIDNGQTSLTYTQTEKFIYGSARLGVQNVNIGLLGSQNNSYTQTTVPHRIGKKGYELSNHLGNVLSVISDKAIPHPSVPVVTGSGGGGSTVDYWQAGILQSTDYSPFGVQLKNRTLSKNGVNDFARFGFQNQEMDNELKGKGNSVNYTFRMHDPRLGRFFAIDPLLIDFPWNSPYSFSENIVISSIEMEGGEKIDIVITGEPANGKNGTAKLTLSMDYMIVTEGKGAVTSKLNPTAFRNNFKKGNQTLYMSSLPSKDSDGQFMFGRQGRLAKKASNGNIKAAQKLKAMGVENFYKVDVEYNYNLIEGGDIISVENWMKEDPTGRGIVIDPFTGNYDKESANIVIDPHLSVPLITVDVYNSDKTILRYNKLANGGFTPNIGALSSNTSFDKKIGIKSNLNIIIINPNTDITDATMIITHECGHNSAAVNIHNTGHFEYDQNGLQSNTNPYPSTQNTEDAINDPTNRQTITVNKQP